MQLMYYEFLVTHLDAPFLLLSAVTTGLIIRIFYNAYMKLKLAMRVLTSVILFIIKKPFYLQIIHKNRKKLKIFGKSNPAI